MTEGNNSGVGMTLKEMVLEIRGDVKSLKSDLARIDREGSIGTREELSDHEQRIRKTEVWLYSIPPTLIIAVLGAVTPWVINAVD